MKTGRISLSILFSIFILTSCATIYEKYDYNGGYSDEKQEEQQYKISFFGNDLSLTSDVYLFFLMRCSEIAQENGFDYFYLTQISNASGSYSMAQNEYHSEVLQEDAANRILIGMDRAFMFSPPISYTSDTIGFIGNILLVNEPLEGEPEPFDSNIILKRGKDRSRDIQNVNYSVWASIGTIILAAGTFTLFMFIN